MRKRDRSLIKLFSLCFINLCIWRQNSDVKNCRVLHNSKLLSRMESYSQAVEQDGQGWVLLPCCWAGWRTKGGDLPPSCWEGWAGLSPTSMLLSRMETYLQAFEQGGGLPPSCWAEWRPTSKQLSRMETYLQAVDQGEDLPPSCWSGWRPTSKLLIMVETYLQAVEQGGE